MSTAFITLALFGLLAIGMPVAFTLAFTGAIGLYTVGGWQALSGVLSTAPLS
ncbi:MAG: TRAP transporter large permease, partial [Proteobacteria bacterium]|nr:TRAP transporter large permease [Pseudomonadota bacterium]